MRLTSLLLMPATLLLAAQTPSLVCPTPSHGFGRLLQGAKVTHTFHLENRGPNPIHIQDVKTSCACTTVPLPTREVGPGGILPLEVSFDTSTFEGLVEKSIVVLTDDPARPALMLDLRAQIVKPYQVHPAALAFRTQSHHARLALSLRLTGADGRMPPAVAATVEGDGAFTTESHALPEENAQEILLERAPGGEAHRVQAKVVLILDDAKRTRLEVPLAGELVEDLSVFPDRLDAGSAGPGGTLGRRLQVLIHHPDVEVTAAQADVPWLETALTQRAAANGSPSLETGRGFTVSLKLAPQAPAGPQRATLTLHTTSRTQPVVQVPCTLTVQ